MGRVYGAIHDPAVPEDQQGGAVQLIRKCQKWAAALRGYDPSSTAYSEAKWYLNDTVEWLNIYRGIYKVLGSSY